MLQNIAVLIDIISGLLLVKLMAEITQEWGWSSTQARWALLRRFMLFAVAIALFSRAAYHAEEGPPLDWVEVVSQFVIVVGLLIYPILRWLGLISQDRWGEPPNHVSGPTEQRRDRPNRDRRALDA